MAIASPVPTCRRSGCRHPATLKSGLCADHDNEQQHLRLALLVPVRRSGGTPGPSVDILAAIVEEKSAPWRRLAACRGRTETMFPSPPGIGHQADYGPALTICATCPVVDPCHDAGKAERLGVWGGTTPTTRGTSRTARRKAAHQPAP